MDVNIKFLMLCSLYYFGFKHGGYHVFISRSTIRAGKLRLKLQFYDSCLFEPAPKNLLLIGLTSVSILTLYFCKNFYYRVNAHLAKSKIGAHIFFNFVSEETKRNCFIFGVSYLHSGGYYPMKRALVTTMSTRYTAGKQSCKNIFFKYRKDNRQQDQK